MVLLLNINDNANIRFYIHPIPDQTDIWQWIVVVFASVDDVVVVVCRTPS